jgi:hypothetical protein
MVSRRPYRAEGGLGGSIKDGVDRADDAAGSEAGHVERCGTNVGVAGAELRQTGLNVPAGDLYIGFAVTKRDMLQRGEVRFDADGVIERAGTARR